MLFFLLISVVFSVSTLFVLSTFLPFLIFSFYYTSFKSSSVFWFFFLSNQLSSVRRVFSLLLSSLPSSSTSFPHSVRIFISPQQTRRLALANIKRMFISNEEKNKKWYSWNAQNIHLICACNNRWQILCKCFCVATEFNFLQAEGVCKMWRKKNAHLRL